MTRKKVNLAYITNDNARKASFKKRKTSIMKLMNELTTLCDIDACAIIFSPYQSHPEVWPSPLGVQRVLAHFNTMPDMEQSKNMMDQETFLRSRINKAYEQLKKQRKDTREKEMTRVMFQSLTGKPLQGLTLSDMTSLSWVIDHHLRQLYHRMKTIKEGAVKIQNQVQGAQVTTATNHRNEDDSSSSDSNNVATESVDEGSTVQHAAMDKQAFHHMHNLGLQMMPYLDHHQHPMGVMGEEMMLLFADHTNHSTMWSNPPPAGGFNF